MPRSILHAAAIAMLMLTAIGCDTKSPQSGQSGSNAIDTATLAPPLPGGAVADTGKPAVDTSARPLMVTHTATIVTTVGDIEVELYGQDAPKTVKNFVELAKKKYYDSIAFHRVVPGFMVQTGDPNSRNADDRESWGEGGKSIYGDTFADELDTNTASGRRGYATGTLAMANAGPNTNGSQFFIVATAQGASHLTYNYTIFGMVTKGMDVVRKIEQTGMQGEKPVSPEKIVTIKVREIPTPEKSMTAAGK